VLDGDIGTDNHHRFFRIDDIMQKSLLERDMVINNIVAEDCIRLIGGNAVADTGVALEAFAVHFLQHDSVVIDVIVDADLAFLFVQAMQPTDILSQSSMPRDWNWSEFAHAGRVY